jgi:peptide/nickel transport system permease protein
MLRFAVHRALQALLVLAVMSFVVYILIGLMPGDPIDIMLSGNPEMTSADADRLRRLYGLDQPLWRRYLAWAGNALAGDFGYSRVHGVPVEAILLPRLANTLVLIGAALVLALAIALPLGVVAAGRAGGRLDTAINLGCFAGISVPPFWLALLLIMLFAVALDWLPAGGTGALEAETAGERVRYMVLPVLTLTLASIAAYTRHIRAAMLEALGQDYMRTAAAKGLRPARALWRHGLPNALLPLITLIALDFGMLFSGALVTETMFGYLGMGKLIYDSVLGNDFNLALVGLLVATAMTLVANLGADVGYAALDPRVTFRRQAA